MPTTAAGNLHETGRPGTVVLGYFSAAEVSKKRIFISFKDLPENLQIPQDRGLCQAEAFL